MRDQRPWFTTKKGANCRGVDKGIQFRDGALEVERKSEAEVFPSTFFFRVLYLIARQKVHGSCRRGTKFSAVRSPNPRSKDPVADINLKTCTAASSASSLSRCLATMAGHKSPKASADKNKKRKREANDADLKSKRHRKEAKANGVAEDSVPSETVNGGEMATRTRVDMVNKAESETGWRVSQPMGGRMLDIDPILTEEEQGASCLVF